MQQYLQKIVGKSFLEKKNLQKNFIKNAKNRKIPQKILKKGTRVWKKFFSI